MILYHVLLLMFIWFFWTQGFYWHCKCISISFAWPIVYTFVEDQWFFCILMICWAQFVNDFTFASSFRPSSCSSRVYACSESEDYYKVAPSSHDSEFWNTCKEQADNEFVLTATVLVITLSCNCNTIWCNCT